jgi:hypothetical protein
MGRILGTDADSLGCGGRICPDRRDRLPVLPRLPGQIRAGERCAAAAVNPNPSWPWERTRGGGEKGLGRRGCGAVRLVRWQFFRDSFKVKRTLSPTTFQEAREAGKSTSRPASALVRSRSSFYSFASAQRFSILRCLFGMLLLNLKSRSRSPNKHTLNPCLDWRHSKEAIPMNRS